MRRPGSRSSTDAVAAEEASFRPAFPATSEDLVRGFAGCAGAVEAPPDLSDRRHAGHSRSSTQQVLRPEQERAPQQTTLAALVLLFAVAVQAQRADEAPARTGGHHPRRWRSRGRVHGRRTEGRPVDDQSLPPVRVIGECDDDAVAWALVGRLTALGLDIDTRGEQGSTPLNEAAARKRSVAVVRALIAAGADVNSRDRSGRTPLHNVIVRRQTHATREVVEYDLTPGIHVRSDRENARQPSAIGLLLLSNGADPNLLDANGMQPLDGVEEHSPLRRTRFHRQLVRRTGSP